MYDGMADSMALDSLPTARPRPRRSAAASMTAATTMDGEALAGLVEAVAHHRDRSAFVTLFEYFGPRVKGFLMRQGASASEAEDLVQDVLMTVWRKADQFDPAKAAVSTWVFTIARNRRIDVLRRERRPEPDPEDPMLAAEPEPSAEAHMTTAQIQTRMRAALKTLPPDQAEVVSLSFYEDLAHSEIAARLGIPLGTVKSRLRLAFRKVRAQVGEELA
jgi:RNA polymerase sigma-70 factor (ECF subfamily)